MRSPDLLEISGGGAWKLSQAPVFRCTISLDKQKQPSYTSALSKQVLIQSIQWDKNVKIMIDNVQNDDNLPYKGETV